jgi:LPXTG-motif cell wall-anchored protein
MISHPQVVTDLILDAARSRASAATPSKTLADTGSTALILASFAGAAAIAGAGMVAVARRRRITKH